MKKTLITFFLILAFFTGANTVWADQIKLIAYDTITINDTTQLKMYYLPSTFTQLGGIMIVDDGIGVGSGVFTGADIDAFFIAQSVNLSTGEIKGLMPSEYIFQGGDAFGGRTDQLRGGTNPKPLFGSLADTVINTGSENPTLDEIDAVFGSSLTGFITPPGIPVPIGQNFLSLGNGGVLIANYDPAIDLPANPSLFVFSGEVDGNDYFNVYASSTPIPEPSTVFIVGMGLGGMGLYFRRRFKK